MVKKKTKFSSWHAPDVSLIGGLLVLLAFGVLMVYDSSAVASLDLGWGQYHFVVLQLVWAGLGLAGGFILFSLDYHRLRKLALPLFLFTSLLLILVLLPTPFSNVIRGSKSWLSLPFDIPGGIQPNIQPSELLKLTLILYLAALFTHRSKAKTPKSKKPSFWSFIIPTLLVTGLVVLEPDYGTAAIVAALGFATFFFGGGSFWTILLALPMALAGGLFLVLSDPGRLERIKAFLNPAEDPLGVSYQTKQILIALGSGGLFGLGIGESRQKYGYIPDISTDAVFAVVGEEFGFVGALAIVGLFMFIVYRGFLIARNAPDDFGRVLAASISTWVGLQVLINLGAVTNLIPLTGVPLPLISYGGSSLVVLLVSFGILLNISRQTVRRKSGKRKQ